MLGRDQLHDERGHAEADAARQAVIEALAFMTFSRPAAWVGRVRRPSLRLGLEFRVLRIEAVVVEGNVKRAVGNGARGAAAREVTAATAGTLTRTDLHPGE